MLAQEEHNVSEFVLNVHGLRTGLNCSIFDQPCEEYNNFVTILQRPGFRRLDLALLVGMLQNDNWVSYRSGYLRQALGSATELEHISLHSDVENHVGDPPTLSDHYGALKNFVPLGTIFPIERWPRLQHFGLMRFLVTQDDVISFLSALPSTVQSVELSFLSFLDYGGSYYGLLYQMREKLDWRVRDISKRPRSLSM